MWPPFVPAATGVTVQVSEQRTPMVVPLPSVLTSKSPLAAPGERLWDLALPVCTFVPLWLEQPADMRRYHTFCEAYGLSFADEHELLNVVVERTQQMWQTLVENVDREPFATLVREGHAHSWRHVLEYVQKRNA
jgi:hypothetical protein